MSKEKKLKYRYESTGVHTGWKKDDPAEVRRRRQLLSHKNDLLATARSLQGLSNVTWEPETKAKAKADAQYFYSLHRRYKKR